MSAIDQAHAALQEDGFVNADIANLGGNCMGVVIPWDESTVLVTEDDQFVVGIYTAEQWDNGDEPVELYEVSSVADVVMSVNKGLGIDE